VRIVLFVLAAVTAVLMPAVYGLAGEEPTGFAEFPWGTPRTTLIPVCGDPLLRQRPPLELWCSDRPIKIGDRQWFANLVFDDRGLGGYEITVRPFAYRDLRDIAVAKFGMYGRPADRQEVISYKGRIGERLMWDGPAGRSSYSISSAAEPPTTRA